MSTTVKNTYIPELFSIYSDLIPPNTTVASSTLSFPQDAIFNTNQSVASACLSGMLFFSFFHC